LWFRGSTELRPNPAASIREIASDFESNERNGDFPRDLRGNRKSGFVKWRCLADAALVAQRSFAARFSGGKRGSMDEESVSRITGFQPVPAM
jgi:hypothetical protein